MILLLALGVLWLAGIVPASRIMYQADGGFYLDPETSVLLGLFWPAVAVLVLFILVSSWVYEKIVGAK